MLGQSCGSANGVCATLVYIHFCSQYISHLVSVAYFLSSKKNKKIESLDTLPVLIICVTTPKFFLFDT